MSDVDIKHLATGSPFVDNGKVYYREFWYKSQGLVKAFLVDQGSVDFRKPHWFDEDTIVKPYNFKK